MEDLLSAHPSLGAALKELQGTALSRPWFPDSGNSAQPISLPQTQHGPHVTPTSQLPPPNVLHTHQGRGSFSQHAHWSAAKRQRPAHRPPQPALQAQGSPAQGALPPASRSRDSGASERHRLAEAALRHDTGHLLFLGTGCAEPSKYRGSSGIHLRFHNGRCRGFTAPL